MTNLPCTAALHAATFASHPHIGFAVADGDILDLRSCALCRATLQRSLGIAARLAQARRQDDVAMVGRCNRALHPDPMTGVIDEISVRSVVDAVELERMMGGGR